MSNAFTKQQDPQHCARCGRRFRDSDTDAGLWNGMWSSGYVTSIVCPGCQTLAESAEAESNRPETETLRIVSWDSLDDRKTAEMITEGIWQRCRDVVTKHKDLAKMAGETHLVVKVDEWADEALQGWPLMHGQPEEFRQVAHGIATSHIREMAGIDKTE